MEEGEGDLGQKKYFFPVCQLKSSHPSIPNREYFVLKLKKA